MKSNYLQKILANRSVLAYFVALVALFVTLIIALDFVLDAHASAEATEQKIQRMIQATEAYDQKKVILDRASAKPITGDKIDEVQTGVLLLIQRHNLGLGNMNSVSSAEAKERDRVFEMDSSGSYDNTMAFLSSFRKDAKALISVLSVSFHPEKEELKTTIKYKVYVR